MPIICFQIIFFIIFIDFRFEIILTIDRVQFNDFINRQKPFQCFRINLPTGILCFQFLYFFHRAYVICWHTSQSAHDGIYHQNILNKVQTGFRQILHVQAKICKCVNCSNKAGILNTHLI